jgi:thiol:disulfide interchange protein
VASVSGSNLKECFMKKCLAALVLAVTVTLASPVVQSTFAQEPIDYRTAYQQAMEGEKPLLILVTATWCPPCQVMKKTTIPTLMAQEAFKGFHYSTVDLDAEEELARELIGDRGVPQLIMYEKKGDKWVRRYLRGIQTPETVQAFVAQAGSLRTANAGSANDLVGK